MKTKTIETEDGCFTLEADSRQQVLVGGDCVQTLPVSQLPNLTGVITTSCCEVIPERTTNISFPVRNVQIRNHFSISQNSNTP